MYVHSLTILFEDPFWIGLLESIEGDQMQVCKVTFGGEPTEQEENKLERKTISKEMREAEKERKYELKKTKRKKKHKGH
ncbi:MAG: DUF2992 family protein [Bacteroidales bacterium]|nr:DUF2992 family protein [Candidatus Cryptobacteroides onthequi]